MDEDTPCGEVSFRLRVGLRGFLSPLLFALDACVDRRLVGTFVRLVETVLLFRNRPLGLLLSELGGYLASPAHAPAGTKRISNLLRCPKWDPELVDVFLWRVAEEHRERLCSEGHDALVIWDDSVVEKPESRKAEGLCPVRSSKAGRLLKVKPGYYKPPTTCPIFVPGLRWLSLLLVGPSGPPSLVAQRWFGTRGEGATDLRSVQQKMLVACQGAWHDLVVHVFDRGFAGNPWIGELLVRHLRFVIRWPKRYVLLDGNDQPTKAWQIARGKPSQDKRLLKETSGPHKGQTRTIGVLALPVRHTEQKTPLTLVVARTGRHQEPWYLLTNEPVATNEQAWRIVSLYLRRWQIECAFRYEKSELALESPRLWTWERRKKLLVIVSLAYAFLLLLLAEVFAPLRLWLLRHFCHRNGKRGRLTPAPLYRLRSALSRLWLAYPAPQSLTPG